MKTRTWCVSVIFVLNTHIAMSASVSGTQWDVNVTFDSLYKRSCPGTGSQNNTSILLPGTLTFGKDNQYTIQLKNNTPYSTGTYVQTDNSLTLTPSSHLLDRKQAAAYLPSLLFTQKVTRWLSLGKKQLLPREASFIGTVSEGEGLSPSMSLEEKRAYQFSNGTSCSNRWTLSTHVKATPYVNTASLTGMLRNEDGIGVEGGIVVAMERSTKKKIKGVTKPDGSFQLHGPPGVYNVGFHHKEDDTLATSFYGPIIVSGATSHDFVIKSSGGKPDESVSGVIYLKTGQPASHHRVRLRPAISLRTDKHPGKAVLPDAVETVTDSEGRFDLVLGTAHEVGMDVEVYHEDGSLDEFIPIAKRDKPAYVEFVTDESPVEDVYRYDIEPPVPFRPLSAAAPTLSASPFMTPISATASTNANTEFQPFSSVVYGTCQNRSGTYNSVLLSEGTIPVDYNNYTEYNHTTMYNRHFYFDDLGLGSYWDDSTNQLNDIVRATLLLPAENQIHHPFLFLGNNGSWWYDYKITVQINPKYPGIFDFTDASDDTYTLWILDPTITHSVSYNSDHPEIAKINFCSTLY